jgi:hypothetical protein
MSERLTISGQVQADLSRYIRQMERGELLREVLLLLFSRFSSLGEPEERGLTSRQLGRLLLKLDRYLVSVDGTRVDVRALSQPRVGDARVIRDLSEAITDLLAGLAGMAMQREIGRAIINAGHSVRTMHRAGDGSVVMEMDGGSLVISLDGRLTLEMDDPSPLLADLVGFGIEVNPQS